MAAVSLKRSIIYIYIHIYTSQCIALYYMYINISYLYYRWSFGVVLYEIFTVGMFAFRITV